jgi:hypothetical protein
MSWARERLASVNVTVAAGVNLTTKCMRLAHPDAFNLPSVLGTTDASKYACQTGMTWHMRGII